MSGADTNPPITNGDLATFRRLLLGNPITRERGLIERIEKMEKELESVNNALRALTDNRQFRVTVLTILFAALPGLGALIIQIIGMLQRGGA